MTADSIFRSVRQYWLPVLVLTLLGMVAGAASAARTPEMHTSTSSLIINPGAPSKGVDLGGLNTFITNRMETYDALAGSAMVINPVIDALKMDEDVKTVGSRLAFDIPTGSTIIDITASAPTADEAIKLSNAVAKSLGSAVVKTTPNQSDGTASVGVMVIQDGRDAVGSQGRSVLLWTVGGGLLGLAAGAATASLLTGLRAGRLAGRRASKGRAA